MVNFIGFIYFINTPLEQFEVTPIYRSIIPVIAKYFLVTNSSFYMLLCMLFLFSILWYYKKFCLIIPSRIQNCVELFFNFVSIIAVENIKIKKQVYLPLVFLVFYFILFLNLIGMVPYSFTVTSHLSVTFSLAFCLFFGLNFIGIRKHGLAFFGLFLPNGTPALIVPFLVIIEFISYIARVFSLSIRLFANMMSGHTLLKILAGFAWSMLHTYGLLAISGVIPVFIVFIVTGLEIAIAFLQAYVFTILICIYINDALSLH